MMRRCATKWLLVVLAFLSGLTVPAVRHTRREAREAMAWKQAAALGGSVQFDVTPSADAVESTRQILRAARGASPIPPERRIAWVTFQGGVFRERHARVCNDLEAGIVLILNDVTLIDRALLTVIPRLRQLVIRSVARQQLIGDFPVLPSLHGITLDNVAIDAGALNRLTDLPELKQLMLAHCEIDDLHAVHFDRLHALRDLRIWLVNGQRLMLPPAVTESVGLEFLELSGFELSNDCVARIGRLPRLRTLGLASTMLPDNTLELLRDSSVTHLTVDDGQITPQQAADFERHKKGRVVEVIRPEPRRADDQIHPAETGLICLVPKRNKGISRKQSDTATRFSQP